MPSVRSITACVVLLASTAAIANVTPRHLVRENAVADGTEAPVADARHRRREHCSYQTLRVWDDYPKTFVTRRVRVCWPHL